VRERNSIKPLTPLFFITAGGTRMARHRGILVVGEHVTEPFSECPHFLGVTIMVAGLPEEALESSTGENDG